MLRSAKDIQRCPVYATDGDVGDVEAFFFDDESWKVRYLVVKAGGLLTNRRVLISPELIGDVDRK
ncbi:MAG: PRC-barrel domain-containing protein, partial [Actinomycetota bacterium]|nr:PRC-barrel domain-containing protein [Actinomycetota bacterium]